MRKLYAVIALAVLIALVPASAFADTPQAPAPVRNDATQFVQGFDILLGDYLIVAVPIQDPVTGFFLLNWPVGGYLYRPPTGGYPGGLPADQYAWYFPGAFADATQWIVGSADSPLRRQTGHTYTDGFGYFYAFFMFPRDEAWYPCSYPCKWKCNFYNYQTGLYTEMHSPAAITFQYNAPNLATALWWMSHEPLFWPWDMLWVDPFLGYVNPYLIPYDPTVTDASPFDTVHPLEFWVVEEVSYYASYVVENKVWGYVWKNTDLQVQYPEDWPYICGF
jgi:hypothetical protein